MGESRSLILDVRAERYDEAHTCTRTDAPTQTNLDSVLLQKHTRTRTDTQTYTRAHAQTQTDLDRVLPAEDHAGAQVADVM